MSESLQQSETPDSSQHSQMPEIFVDALEEQLDIPDDVFLNEQGVPPPPDKSRCSVIEYQHKFKEKIFRAETDEYKVRKALAKCNNRNLLLALLRTVNNIDNNVTDLKKDINNIKGDINNIKGVMNIIKGDINNMKPLMFSDTRIRKHSS